MTEGQPTDHNAAYQTETIQYLSKLAFAAAKSNRKPYDHAACLRRVRSHQANIDTRETEGQPIDITPIDRRSTPRAWQSALPSGGLPSVYKTIDKPRTSIDGGAADA